MGTLENVAAYLKDRPMAMCGHVGGPGSLIATTPVDDPPAAPGAQRPVDTRSTRVRAAAAIEARSLQSAKNYDLAHLNKLVAWAPSNLPIRTCSPDTSSTSQNGQETL